MNTHRFYTHVHLFHHLTKTDCMSITAMSQSSSDDSEYFKRPLYKTAGKGPRSSLCTQVPCLAVKKWNRSIITESNIFINASYQLSEKNTPDFC